MKKIELFKGMLSGTVTLYNGGLHFVIKLNEEIEGIPKEFLVEYYHIRIYSKPKGTPIYKYIRGSVLRRGDIVSIGGVLFQYFLGKEQIENIKMKANYIYNTTLKQGAGLKIKKKEVFNGILSGTATSDQLYSFSQLGIVFSIKLDMEIEGIPNEFVVYSTSLHDLIIKKGDQVTIEGKLYQGGMVYDEFQINEMETSHIYNKTLKCGR
ncbi:MAG: hypothetical protein ACFFCM_05885 [Promethearchaeota archaeon]